MQTPKQTQLNQAHHIEEEQIINENTFDLDVSKNTRGNATKSYEHVDLLSQTSLERVSPPKEKDEVFTNISKYQIKLTVFIY